MKDKPLTDRQTAALQFIADGWEVLGPTPHFFRGLAGPWERRGVYWTRLYLPVSDCGDLAALRSRGLVRLKSYSRFNDNLAITAKGKRELIGAV